MFSALKKLWILVCFGTCALWAQQAPVSDEFVGTSLNTGLWQTSTSSGGTVTVSGGVATLAVPAGSNHDPNASGTNLSTRIMQSVANADFDVAAKFNGSVSQAYQGFGLLVQQDASNFLRCEIRSDGSSAFITGFNTVGGNGTFIFDTAIVAPNPVWIRVTKVSNSYTISTSPDGITYTAQGTVNTSMTVAQIGPYAYNYNPTPASAPATSVGVDYFHNLAGTQGTFDGGIITDGNFESGVGPWTFFTNGAGSFNVNTNQSLAGSSADVAITTIGSNTQLYQSSLAVAPQQSYTLTFAAKASVARTIDVSLIQGASPFANYGLSQQQFSLGTAWQTFSITFTSSNNAAVADGRLIFSLGDFGQSGDEYWFDNVSLVANGTGVGGTSAAVVQSATGTNSSGGNASVSFPSSTASGNTVLVFVAAWLNTGSAQITGVTDSAGNAYTLVTTASYDDGVSSFPNNIAVYRSTASTNASLTVTAAVTNTGGDTTVMAMEVSGAVSGNPIDASAVVNNAIAVSLTTPGIATTTANELIIGFGANESTTSAPSSGTGFTKAQSTCGCNAVEAAILEYNFVTATGTYSATMTNSSSIRWGGVVIGVKLNASGGGGGGVTTGGIGLTGQVNSQPSNSRNVKTDCGAAGNGSTNDTAAIQSCINGLSTNQTLYFPDGTYLIGSTVHLKENETYLGHSTSGVILHGASQPMAILDTSYANPLNITLSTMTIDGGNMYLNGDNNGAAYVHITNVQFQNLTAAGDFRSVSFITADQSGDIGGMTHVNIDHCRFYNLLQDGQTVINGNIDYDGDTPRAAIWAYGFDNTSIDHNVFDTLYQGIKGCQDVTHILSNFYVGYNIFTNIHRMAMEVQGGNGCGHDNSSIGINTDAFTFEYNLAYNWLNYYYNSFGLSWADTPSTNTHVNNNIIIGSPYYESPGVPAFNPGNGYEIGSQPAIVHDNVAQGPYGLAIGIFGGSTGSQVYQNWACNVDINATAPVIGDEHGTTDTNYHNNYTIYPCNNNGAGGLLATTSISLVTPTLTGSTLTSSSTTTTINPSIATVSYLIDGTSVSSNNVGGYNLGNSSTINSSLSTNVSALSAGSHSLIAVATDVWGNNWNSPSKSFTTTTSTTNPACTVSGKVAIAGQVVFH